MKTHFDRRKSLQDLEREDWGEPTFDSSLVRTCHRLRRVPLVDFTAGDLRIMISQKISLLFLVPLALEKLKEDPLAESNTYPGDLLHAVLDIPVTFWNIHTDMREELRQIIVTAEQLLESLDDLETGCIRDRLKAVEKQLPNFTAPNLDTAN